MPDFVTARKQVLKSLEQELVGPKPVGKPLDLMTTTRFDTWKESYGPWYDAATGEEILTVAGPATRYGVGVLFPLSARGQSADVDDGDGSEGQDEELPVPVDKQISEEASGHIAESAARAAAQIPDRAGNDEFDLYTANTYNPNAMAVTCRVRLPEGSWVRIAATFGRYRAFTIGIDNSEQVWYRRQPVGLTAAFTAEQLTQSPHRKKVAEHPDYRERSGDEDLVIDVEAFSRPSGEDRLVTFCIANRTTVGSKDTASLFQVAFQVIAEDGAEVLPYRTSGSRLSDDPEQDSIELLYRNLPMYAVGHGCAADWKSDSEGRCHMVEACVLPRFETPSITPEIEVDGQKLRVDMRRLADPDQADMAAEQVEGLITAYQKWIVLREAEVSSVPESLTTAAGQHLAACREALARMRVGWNLVRGDPTVRTAFVLANQAMLLQQARSSDGLRKAAVTADGGLMFDREPPSPNPPKDRGYWHPFQIGFFLSVIESVVNNESPDRDAVELIFFPTGGGKTEAYLGVAAFSMFLRRLRDTDDDGTHVLMRYTLRLLTTQQFLRASALICAMEEVREHTPALGPHEFSVGIWVGGDATPNNRKMAVTAFNKLSSGGQNPFLLLQCPWCNAEFGPIATEAGKREKKKRKIAVSGYELDGHAPTGIGRNSSSTVRFQCSDRRCYYSRRPLPVYVIDDDLYAFRPTMVIGTVDKFAMLSWRPQARFLFGLNEDGHRVKSPPGLIIQDELHLISGPLGSVSGLYEGMIEELCTDRRSGQVRPKVIASTATIRRYEQQVRDLYGRDTARLFPPHGLTADNSFFAQWARDKKGNLAHGRLYVGVHGPGLGSMQTVQVRTASALLQAPMELDADERDPWWTCLSFFNSLRELGNTLTLLQSDIPTYVGGMNVRDGLDSDRRRWANWTFELTSRLTDAEIPRAIKRLEVPVGGSGCIDVCLASSIVEVGIDIPRLSLMTVVGQPKTTSQYIQVTGRVGRKWEVRPGLVVTLYGAAKPRDRSHFERFRSYHEQLYAQVEPTSVTPFALPVLKRAVHGAIVAYVRQRTPLGGDPYPVPWERFDEAAQLLRERAQKIDFAQMADLNRELDERRQQWRDWGRTTWDANPESGNPTTGLMRYPATEIDSEYRGVTWETPASMRDVDASCKIHITSAYAAHANRGGNEGEAS